MTDIVKFLTARLADDEAYAVEAAEEFGPDWIEIWSGQIDLSANLPDRQPPAGRHWDAHVQTNDSRVSRHMVRHDPARVLAEVKAKRALIEHWRTYAEQHRRDDCDPEARSAWVALVDVLVTLAGVYRTHPDYAGDSFDDWTRPDDDPAWRADA